jgi:hypothetical protein
MQEVEMLETICLFSFASSFTWTLGDRLLRFRNEAERTGAGVQLVPSESELLVDPPFFSESLGWTILFQARMVDQKDEEGKRQLLLRLTPEVWLDRSRRLICQNLRA